MLKKREVAAFAERGVGGGVECVALRLVKLMLVSFLPVSKVGERTEGGGKEENVVLGFYFDQNKGRFNLLH